jgi:DNA primase
VVFSFDGDAAGRRAAGRALEAVLPHATDTRRISFLFLPAEHDPDSYIREFGPEAFEVCIKKAVPLSRQVLEHASADCDLDSAEGRARLLVQAIPLIAQFPEGALKGLIADDLAQMARAAPNEVRRRIAEHPLPGTRGTGQTTRAGSERPRNVDGGPPPFEQDEGAPAGPMDDQHIPTFEPDGGNEAWADVYAEQGQAAYTPPEPARRRDGQPWKPWKSGGSSRWQSRGSPVVQRPVPQAATPLDRIVWALISHSNFWEQLPSATQDLLCDQAAPYGEFFRWLDHTVLNHGPLPREELTHQMTAEPSDTGDHAEAAHFKALARRIAHFHELPDDQDTVQSLVYLIKPIELVSLNEELNLLLESGELSEAAEKRKTELFGLTKDLKLEISQHRPISG